MRNITYNKGPEPKTVTLEDVTFTLRPEDILITSDKGHSLFSIGDEDYQAALRQVPTFNNQLTKWGKRLLIGAGLYFLTSIGYVHAAKEHPTETHNVTAPVAQAFIPTQAIAAELEGDFTGSTKRPNASHIETILINAGYSPGQANTLTFQGVPLAYSLHVAKRMGTFRGADVKALYDNYSIEDLEALLNKTHNATILLAANNDISAEDILHPEKANLTPANQNFTNQYVHALRTYTTDELKEFKNTFEDVFPDDEALLNLLNLYQLNHEEKLAQTDLNAFIQKHNITEPRQINILTKYDLSEANTLIRATDLDFTIKLQDTGCPYHIAKETINSPLYQRLQQAQLPEFMQLMKTTQHYKPEMICELLDSGLALDELFFDERRLNFILGGPYFSDERIAAERTFFNRWYDYPQQ